MGLDNINKIRKQKGLSIEELSVKSGIPIGTLSKITAGITKDPKLETVKAIAKALDCTLEELSDDQKNSLDLSNLEQLFIKKYQRLNDAGKKKADDYINDLLGNEKYTSDASPGAAGMDAEFSEEIC